MSAGLASVRSAAVAALAACALVLFAAPAQAGIFDDDEARRAILELRKQLEQNNEQARARQAEQMAVMNDSIGQLKRSLLDLNSQIEMQRSDNARLRGQIEELRVRAKRAGHMPPKMRFLGAQMAAYLAGDLWLDLAGRANRAATGLAGVLTGPAAGRLAHPVDGNEVFVELSNEAAGRLTQAGATFYRWIDGSHRFVCSWTTTDAEIAAAAAVFAGVGARHDA